MSNPSPSDEELEEEETFCCNICSITCLTALNLQTHFLGAKHKKAEEALRNHKDNKAEFRLTLEDQINACKDSEPAVGLEYIFDYGYQYECKLCDTSLSLTSMFMHIVGGKHRLKYLNQHHSSMVEDAELHPGYAKGPKKLAKIKEICMQVEKEFGRRQINVATVEQMESALPKAPTFPEDPAARPTESLMRRALKEYDKWGFSGGNRYGPDSNMDFTSDDFTVLDKPKEKTLPVTFKELKAVNEEYMKNRKNRKELKSFISLSIPPPAQPKVDENVVTEVEPDKEDPKKDEKENEDTKKNKDESDGDSDECSIDFSGEVDEFITNQDLFDFLEKFKVFGIEDVQFILKVREKMQAALTLHRYWPGRPRRKKPESVTKAIEHAAKQKQLKDKVKKVKVQKQQHPAIPPQVSSYSPYPTYFVDEKHTESTTESNQSGQHSESHLLSSDPVTEQSYFQPEFTTESNQEQPLPATNLQDNHAVTEPSSLEPEPTTEKNQDESLSENHLQKNKPSCTEQEYRPTNKKLSFKISAPPVEVNPLVASGVLSNLQQEFAAKSNPSRAQDTKLSLKSTPKSHKEPVSKRNSSKMLHLSELKENKKVHDTKPPSTSASNTPQEFAAKSSPDESESSSDEQDAKPSRKSISYFLQEFLGQKNPVKSHHSSQLKDDHKVQSIKPSSESASDSPQGIKKKFADKSSPSTKQVLSQLNDNNKEPDTKPSSTSASDSPQEISAKSSPRKMQNLSQLNDDLNKDVQDTKPSSNPASDSPQEISAKSSPRKMQNPSQLNDDINKDVQDTKPSSNPASDSPQEPAAERDGSSLPVQQLDSQTSVSEPEPCSNLEPVIHSEKEGLNSQQDNRESAPEPDPLVSPGLQDPRFSTPQQSNDTPTTKPRRNKSRWIQQETAVADQKTPAAVEEFLKRFEKFKTLKPPQASNNPAGSSSSKPPDSNECSKSPGVNPPGSVPPGGVNPPGSAPSRGVNPSGSAPSRGVNPSGSAPSRGVNPPGSAPSRGVNPPGSAPSRGVNPAGSAPPRGVNPPASAPSRGVNPPASAPPRGVNYPASASPRGLNPGFVPPRTVNPYERFNQPSEYTPSRPVNQEQIRESAHFVSPNGQNVYEHSRNDNSPAPPRAPNSNELFRNVPGPAPPRAPNSHEQFRNAPEIAHPRAPNSYEQFINAPGPAPPRAPNSHEQFRNAPGPAPPRAPNPHDQFRNVQGLAPPRAPNSHEQFRNVQGLAPPRAPNAHEQFRNAPGPANPGAPNSHEQFRNAPGPAPPRAPNTQEQFRNVPGPAPPRAPNTHEQFRNVPGPACPRAPNSHEQFRNTPEPAFPRAPNSHEQFRNDPEPGFPRAPNSHEQFRNAPGPAPLRAPHSQEQFRNAPGPACFRPPNAYGWPGSSAALASPRAPFPQESNAPRTTIPPFLANAQNDITSKFFDSLKNMEVSEVVETLTKITASNPAFKGIHVPSLVQYLIDTGKLKPPSNAQNR